MPCLMHGKRNYTGGGGGGASAISDLTDVNIDDQTLDEGQVLKWDSVNEQWVNEDESGGTAVIANPTGTPTEQLNTIQIGEDIYEIVGGGGGSSYSVTELYSGTTITATVQISDSFDNYDALQFTTGFVYSGRTYLMSCIILKSDLDDALANEKWIVMGYSSNNYCFGKVTANNEFTQCYGSGYLYSVKGIKYASGGGTGGASELADLEDVTITNPSYGDVLQYNTFTQKWENGGVGNMPSDLDYSNNVADKTRINSILGQYVTNNYVSTFICRINVTTAYTSSNLDTKMVQGLPSGFDISDTKIPLQVYTSDTSSDVKFYLYKDGIYNKTAIPVGNYVIVGSYIPQWY